MSNVNVCLSVIAHGPVKELKVWPHGDQLWLEWKPPSRTDVTEYVVQWVRGNQIDWQRESRHTTQTAIKGNHLKQH